MSPVPFPAPPWLPDGPVPILGLRRRLKVNRRYG
jgi:hypothetical protein